MPSFILVSADKAPPIPGRIGGHLSELSEALLAMKEGEFLFVPDMAGNAVGSKVRWVKQKTGHLYTYRVMEWAGVAGVGVWRIAKPQLNRPLPRRAAVARSGRRPSPR
jgi:hypothetical protein